MIRIGIDIGGTFTDLVLVDDANGHVHVGKVLTTPHDPAEGTLNGFGHILETTGISASKVAAVVHATTLAANALIERSAPPAGIITTGGFTDILEIAREKRFDLYDLFLEIPPPLIPEALRIGVGERTDFSGNITQAVQKEEVAEAARTLRSRGARSIAVVFLHAASNPENEIAAVSAVREADSALWVCRSSAVAPEIGEYERSSTTAANAYVQPLVDQYLTRLLGSLRDRGFEGELSIMLSNGGFAGVESVRRVPIRIVESGPAGGALAAAQIARANDEPHAIGFDMGGTTAKICLIEGGEPATVKAFEVARTSRFQKGSGLPILTSTVDLVEIGAGGGSIAQVGGMGLLHVGPQSAGAEPGPACYGRGGTVPTVTDAILLMGYLNPDFFLGGEMKLSTDAARSALSGLAKKLGISVEETAWGVFEIVTEQMASAARVHIAEKGADPRQYVFIATGGAGPAHAFHIARKLYINRIVCPPAAGVASTVGLLMARPRSDAVHAYVADVTEVDWKRVNSIFGEMKNQVLEGLGVAGEEEGEWTFRVAADMRYRGQVDSVTVQAPGKEGFPVPDGEALKRLFEEAYIARYRRKIEGVPVEFAAWRLTLLGPQPARVDMRPPPEAEEALFLKGERPIYLGPEMGYGEADVYDRYALPGGERFAGPAVIEERESTTIVPPGATFERDDSGNLLLALGEE